ncbi:inner membrane protein YghB [Enterobacter cancerogenus]|uniref:Inner membrane protein YghB n=1 Tax=Enterobacter cancerogenus TaxID=69218 RepID=A0A484YCF1_9ENTR|nr:inner membrane protein YghB [Enterobacter cancerogenus]
MAVIQDIIAALWQHDFAALADPHVVGIVYFVMFATPVSGKWITASLVSAR